MIVQFLANLFRLTTCAACLLFIPTAWTQTCGAPGKDGPAAISGTVNTYYQPTPNATFGSGSPVIGLTSPIGAATAIGPGDMVLVIQMQCENINTTNSSNYGAGNGTGRGYTDPAGSCAAGLYEYVRAGPATTSTSLDLSSSPLVNTYISDPTTATNRRTFQIVRVPQYSSASLTGTLTAPSWNGNAGGVVVIDVAGNLNLNGGAIDVAGKGFRGGGGATWTGTGLDSINFVVATDLTQNIGAMKGEGIAGTPRLVYDAVTNTVVDNGATWGGYANGDQAIGAPGTAGGGGQNRNGNQDNPGGGGGGNGGTGGLGGYGYKGGGWNGTFTSPPDLDLRGIGGATFTQASTNRLVLGGGGGAGGVNNFPAVDSSGGAGGGVVLVRTGSTSGTGSINAAGAVGRTQPGNDAGGGAGAGGSVVFISASGSVGVLTVNAQGGRGGDGSYAATGGEAHAGGGGGGGGVVATSGPASIDTTGGTNGATAQNRSADGTTANGASPGTNGTSSNNITGQPTGVRSGGLATCAPQLTVAKSTTTPLISVPAGTTATYKITVSNANTAGAAFGVALTDVLPPPFTLQSVGALATTTLAGISTAGPSPTVANTSGNQQTAIFGVAGTGNNPTTPSFTIFPGGSVTLTFVVNLNTATPGTFQNTATVAFTDPTRTTGGAATGNSTTVNPTVTPGGTFAAGGTVGGSNYNSGSSTAEDVRLQGTALITVSKSNGVTGLTSGQSTTYTIIVGNQGPSAAPGTTLTDPATPGLSCTTVTCSIGSGAAVCPATSIGALQSPGITIATLPANSSLNFVVTCTVTATGQ